MYKLRANFTAFLRDELFFERMNIHFGNFENIIELIPPIFICVTNYDDETHE